MTDERLQLLEDTLDKMEATHAATVTLWLKEARQLTQAIRTERAENAALRAKLDAVPDYVDYCYAALSERNEQPMTLNTWYAFVTTPEADTDTAADGIIIPDDGGDE